ncbi:putative galactose oxidase [Aspergillus ruber CBS 135680]|uniref:Putative galactose oxidase n=1 Tax=Aspergillus ruber (strain CBS 135680) TaxID=1388766 RepID=A0A017S4N2_ASPRC|nr:putative galactose oxidase [Aspergillus ruber CBS 135680]EYE91983.1 putative galactose oxidase [Aspergillus ruber CBS 135680]
MKFQWASPLLLGAVAVDAFMPPEFSYKSSDSDGVDIAKSVSGKIKYQSPPADSDLIPKYSEKNSTENWEVQCSSQFEGSKCEYAIDDRGEKYWQSDPNEKNSSWIVVDLRKEYYVSGLTMLPILDKSLNRGQIGEHTIAISQDNETWTQVAYGTWGSNKSPKMSAFDPKPARYIKLDAITQSHPDRSQEGGKNNISVANIAVYAYKEGTYPKDDPSKGVWGPTLDLPVVPVAAAVDQHGDVIMWSAWSDDQFYASPGGKTLTTTLDRDGSITQSVVNETKHDMFCPGTSMDIDGNIIVSGGADSGRTSVYNGTAWLKGPTMSISRGYHSSTTLSDGRLFVIGGSWSGSDKTIKNGEVYYPGENARWERRPGAKVDEMLTDDQKGIWRADNHGWLFGWKNESVFQAGPSVAMHWFNPDGKDHKNRVKGTTHPAGTRGNDHDSMSGSANMYDATKGKIIAFGGQRHYDGSYGSKNAHVITLGDAYKHPEVKIAGKGPDGKGDGGMHHARVFHTSAILPDGKVFIAGGNTWGAPFHEDDIVFTSEIYDPETDTFTEQARNNIKRVYHSISVLLPDARVLNGGGGLCGNCSANHYDAEIYTPSYLFNKDGTRATRPKILNGPEKVTVGGGLEFRTDSKIKTASLVRVGTTTHTVNTDQRRVPLERMRHYGNNKYGADLPQDPGVLLAGWYMLFAMSEQGTPSEAKMVKVELASPPTYLSNGYADQKEVDMGSAIKTPSDCDLDDESEIKGIVSIVFAAPSKLWRSWRSAFTIQP